MNDRLFYDQSCPKHQSDRDNWRDYQHSKFSIPADVRPWLLDEGSLTNHLQRASREQFNVQLLQQRWARPHPHEGKILGMALREVAQVRETLLLVDGEAWVFARSIIPVRSLTGANRRLRYLGNRSLGSWLFQARTLRRSQFQVARLTSADSIMPAALHCEQRLWGRRSRFEIAGEPILVCEIFLPSFKPWPTTAGITRR
jgi:chorismate--pyruvate lyase